MLGDEIYQGLPAIKKTSEKEIAISDGPFLTDTNGFIRHFLICGPFPNPGGDQQLGFNVDYFLKKVGGFLIGGEEDITPLQGISYQVIFPKTKEGYWDIVVEELKCSWKGHASSESYYSLFTKFIFPYNIIAYAACYIESPENREAKVKIGVTMDIKCG